MARRPNTTIDDKNLLVGRLRKNYLESFELFGERREWENDYIQDNLKDTLRPYQTETLEFFHDSQSNPNANTKYRHLLFNMATGAGKTMIMASVMLYLFKEKKQQNFLFFVHTDGILQKTVDNLINTNSSKYLFTQSIEIDGRTIRIEKVDTFPKFADNNTIYLKLATIGKIHSDLNKPKENSLTYEDLKDTSLVMLADEAHHYNAQTINANSDDEKAWERTISRILASNQNNMLLEFTATIDLTNSDLFNKYKDKVIQRYDLKRFMQDGFSKKVMLLQINQDDKTKMLDAVLLSQYRKLVAIKHGVFGFKPVILFKSNLIATSLAKHEEFDSLISSLTANDISSHLEDKRKLLSDKPNSIWNTVIKFYSALDMQSVVDGIKIDFKPLNIINANGKDMVSEDNVKILNSLEDANNPFRVVFAVAKLSEGWDVLNLYDIVRISENASTSTTSTNQEAQLIGRGARYFPFFYDGEKTTKRRFDNTNHELSILEQLHYHTINETSYINNLNNSFSKAQLVIGLDGNERVLTANLKSAFIESDIYKNGKLYLNRVRKISDEERSMRTYSISDEVFLSYKITDENILSNIKTSNSNFLLNSNVKIDQLEVGKPYFRKVMQRLRFYQFDNLSKYFPKIESIDDFIENHLNKIKISVAVPNGISIEDLIPQEKLFLLETALAKIADNIRKNYAKAMGTKTFYGASLKNFIKEKYEIRIDDSLQSDATQKITEIGMTGKKWYVYDKAILNQFEHQMVQNIGEIIGKLQEKYDDVYLIRNDERSSGFKLVQFDGVQGFMPDFILLLSNKQENLFYQVFLEPKGEPYYQKDKWKEQMLEKLNDDDVIVEETDNVRLVGIKFYRQYNDGENDFTQVFFDDLSNKLYDGKPLFRTKTALINSQPNLF